jgi:hypothetical protein
MPGQAKPNYKITPTRPGSTRGMGYHDLTEFVGVVPQHRPAQAPSAPTGQTASFRQGIADASLGQPHHVARSFVVGLVVGAVVGDAVARMRGRR